MSRPERYCITRRVTVMISMLSRGWLRCSSITAGAAIYALKPSVALIRTTPEKSWSGSVPASSWPSAVSTCWAIRMARLPSSVSSHAPTDLTSTRPPRACSRAAIRRDTVVWFTPRAVAAELKRPVRDTARRTSRSSGFGVISAILHLCGA